MNGHEFSLRGVPGSRLLIAVCTCGWETAPTHLSNLEQDRQAHLRQVTNA